MNSIMSKLRRHYKTGLRRVRAVIRSIMERRLPPGTLIAGRYLVLNKLGMGSYGVAFLCQDALSGDNVVLKGVYALSGGKSRSAAIYQRETDTLSRLIHPGIPQLIDRFSAKGMACLVMEHMPGRTLEDLLFLHNTKFTEEQSLRILRDVLHIVKYLHGEGIIHRDISISNVMLEDDGSVQLIDFGLAARQGSGLTDTTPSPSTMEFDEDDPLEKKLRRKPCPSSDFYAAGHLLLFLLYSRNEENPEKNKPARKAGADWTEELTLHPRTVELLERLLQTTAPYDKADHIIHAIDLILENLPAVPSL